MSLYMKRFTFLSAFILLAVVFIADASATNDVQDTHKEQGLSCADCHETDTPDSAPSKSACLSCHDSYEALAEKTSKLNPNPHKSHQGELRCTYCHGTHKPSVLYCNECHNLTEFKFK